jgi:cytochrome P450
MYDILSDRRQHRRIVMQVLNPKVIQGYASVLDYEAHILVRSMYFETRMGTMPINPAHFVGRYALKYVTKCFVSLWM